jgi:DNA polymerase III epsilon subunit-like protein
MSDLLTFCACIDPRRINPSTGHYPGCPDSIIPPECLLPPWEVVITEERVYAGKGARSERHPDGKPIFDVIQRTNLVPGRAWSELRKAPAPVETTRAASPAAEAFDAPDTGSIVCVLDTETTGLTDPRVCEIALAVVDLSSPSSPGEPKIIARHAKLLNPGKSIEPSAVRVHGIRDEDVRDCPTLADVWEKLVAWVEKYATRPGHPPQIVAHNAAYDRRAITGSLPLLPGELPPWHWRCSMALAKRVTPGLPSYSLHDDPSKGKVGLATSLKLLKGESHRAMGDVLTTVSLLGALRARAGVWSAWRGEAVSWAGKAAAGAAVEAPVQAEKPAPATLPPLAAPASKGKQRKPARAVPQGPSLFDLIAAKESA